MLAEIFATGLANHQRSGGAGGVSLWSINTVWAFLWEKARITDFGCHRDGKTLAASLDSQNRTGKDYGFC
jgi:hypothetical protein